MSEENEKKARNYLFYACTGLLTILIVNRVWPGVIPFETLAVWRTTGDVGDWLAAGWPFLAWGFGIQAVILLAHWEARFMKNAFQEASAWEILKAGTLVSLWAGVMEELSFRWLIFYANIVWVKVANFFVFGFLGFGLARFFHLNLFGPIADYTTLGSLHAFLFSPVTWAVGGSMLVTNAVFRDGHTYQGWFGRLNSWFLGMAFFWLMFRFGLPAAILIHFLYDFVIFGTIALFATIRKR